MFFFMYENNARVRLSYQWRSVATVASYWPECSSRGSKRALLTGRCRYRSASWWCHCRAAPPPGRWWGDRRWWGRRDWAEGRRETRADEMMLEYVRRNTLKRWYHWLCFLPWEVSFCLAASSADTVAPEWTNQQRTSSWSCSSWSIWRRLRHTGISEPWCPAETYTKHCESDCEM